MQRLLANIPNKVMTLKQAKPARLSLFSSVRCSYATFFGNPLEAKPAWKDNRGLDAICSLHKLNSSFLDTFHQPFIIIDMGCGKGNALEQIKARYPKAYTIGATATSVDKKSEESIDEIHYGYLPDSRSLFLKHAGKADVVLETMGPTLYGKNPIHMIIAECSLLKEGGKLSSVTIGNTTDSRFGDTETRMKLQKFLVKFGMDVKFHFYKTLSKARLTGDLDITICTITAKKSGAYIAYNLDRIFKEADQMIGIPKEVNNQNCTFKSPDGFPTEGFGSILYDFPDLSKKSKLTFS